MDVLSDLRFDSRASFRSSEGRVYNHSVTSASKRNTSLVGAVDWNGRPCAQGSGELTNEEVEIS